MPDFSIKPATDNVLNTTQSYINDYVVSKKKKLKSAYNDFMGITDFIGEENVFDIFNCVEEIETATEYGYSQQKSIGQKPVLTYTGEGLKQYTLNVLLNYKYCRPDYIIEKLKENAALELPFSYYQGDKYIGEYVITRINEKLKDTYKGVTLNAEISVDILECPVLQDEEYEQQTKTTPDISADIKSVSETGIKTPVSVIKDTAEDVFARITDIAADKALRTAGSYLNGTFPIYSIIPILLYFPAAIIGGMDGIL